MAMRRFGAVVGLVALAGAGLASAGRAGGARTHTLAWGETLGRVAARFGVSVADLAAANRIGDPNRVRAGRVLTIPGGPAPGPAPVVALEPLPSPVVVVGEADRRHRVELGDTLGLIAKRYGTTVADLARANGLADPNRIRAGVALLVPGPPWLCPVQGARTFTDTWGAAREGGRRHLGTDVFAARGTPVVASVGGTVEPAPGARAGLAYYLRGEDGNTYYGAHLEALTATGPVARGGVIGTVGTTGNAGATAPHLHFELLPGGGPPVNPFATLTRWC